jgi:uncharacterized membrane protein YGL010W
MKSLTQQLGQYAAYHQDKRNLVTHFVGIPMIVAAVAVLLSKPAIEIGGWRLSAAAFLVAASIFYYLRLDRKIGLVMAVLYGVALWFGDSIAQLDTLSWALWGVGLFVVGWVIQFIGHIFEGRKPAFFDDVMGLAIGPLFVVVEAGFLLGMGRKLQENMNLIAASSRN